MNRRVKVKLCGMRQAEQVRAAVNLGVDAIGMILHANSPRLIDMEQARLIRREVPAFVSLVGVFVDCPADKIEQYVSGVGLDLVQLHGDESDDFGHRLSAPYIKAIRARTEDQVASQVAAYPSARALLLDPYVENQHGGTGQQLDLALWPQTEHKLILAGGLSHDNVAIAAAQVKPFAVDLNSGLESSPGVKDIALVEQALLALGR